MTEMIKEFTSIDGRGLKLRDVLIGVAGALFIYGASWALVLIDVAIRG